MEVTHPTPIRVLIVDDHPLVRRGLTSLLNGTTDIKVVGAASDGEEAVAYAVEEHPDIVLMDISMPGMNGFEALRRMLKAVAGTKVVMLTSYSEHDMVVEAIDNGAVGFLLKDTEPQELLNGIRSAAKGDTPLSPKAREGAAADRIKRRPLDDLTQRELDVLTLVGTGDEQQADRLAIRHQREDGEGAPRLGLRSASASRTACRRRSGRSATGSSEERVVRAVTHGVEATTIARENAATDCSRSTSVCTDEQNALVLRMSTPSARMALAILACAFGSPRKMWRMLDSRRMVPGIPAAASADVHSPASVTRRPRRCARDAVGDDAQRRNPGHSAEGVGIERARVRDCGREELDEVVRDLRPHRTAGHRPLPCRAR